MNGSTDVAPCPERGKSVRPRQQRSAWTLRPPMCRVNRNPPNISVGESRRLSMTPLPLTFPMLHRHHIHCLNTSCRVCHVVLSRVEPGRSVCVVPCSILSLDPSGQESSAAIPPDTSAQLVEMHGVLDALSKQNLAPAERWVTAHSPFFLYARARACVCVV